jgi:branched-chain amino acid transport system substrate-binding protein
MEGTAACNAFQLSIEEANKSGRFPYSIEIIIVDDQSDEDVAADGARRIVSDPLVIGVTGFWNSGPAAAAIPIFIESKVPLLIWGAIRENLTNEYNTPWITRSAPTDKQENSPLAKAVLDDMKYRDWFVVSDVSAYGTGNLEAFSRELSARGITPLATEHVQEDARDFSRIVRKIKSSGAKAVYCGSTHDIGCQLKRQLYEAGLTDILFCGISGMKTEDFLSIGSKAAEGALVVSPGIILKETETGRRFIKLYNSKGYSEPIGAYTPYAYEAALILLNSLSFCSDNPTSSEMADAIFQSKTIGIMGTTSFNEIGQTVNVAAYLNVAQDGSWVPYQNSEYSKGSRLFGGRK